MQSKYIQVNGIRLHYMEAGQGELVILLHGFPEFWYSWREQIPVLAQKYRVIALDMRGYNLSDKPGRVSEYKIDQLASDVAELITALGQQQAIVIGHDWGAAVAWATAILHSNRVKKLGIINVPHPEEMRKALLGFNFAQLLKSYYIFFFQIPGLPEWFMGRNLPRFFKRVFKNMSANQRELSDQDAQLYAEAYRQPGGITGPLSYYRAMVRYANGVRLNTPIHMPVLMLWGEKDKALGKELTYNTSAYCTNLTLKYDAGSGHFVQHENPTWVNQQLMHFLQQ